MLRRRPSPIFNLRDGLERVAKALFALLLCQAANKLLQRTVTRRCGRGAPAQLRRYASNPLSWSEFKKSQAVRVIGASLE
jgi:hypothetical protein